MKLTVGDRSPRPRYAFTIEGVPVDLTGATVMFRMREITAPVGEYVVEHSAALESPDPLDPVWARYGLGPYPYQATYNWQSGDTDVAGVYEAWFTVVLGTGRPQSSEPFTVDINEAGRALPSTALVSLEEARRALNMDTADTSRDDELEDLIVGASAAIQDWCGRQFAPKELAVTKRLYYRHGGRLRLPDARNVTAVVADPLGRNLTLATSDYLLYPTTQPDGVYESLHFGTAGTVTDGSWVDVTADWGFLNVPPVIRRATAITVASWADSGVEQDVSMGEARGGGVPGVGGWAIPPAARVLAGSYRHAGVA